MPPPRVRRDACLHFVEVAPMAGDEAVEPGDRLPQSEQRFHQVRADEGGAAGDQGARRHGVGRAQSGRPNSYQFTAITAAMKRKIGSRASIGGAFSTTGFRPL